jgi:hypothetical protein
VFLGHPVDIAAELQGQICHVQGVPFVEDALQPKKIIPLSKHPPREIQRKFIVSCGNRGMGRKNTSVPYRFSILLNDRFPSGPPRLLVQKFQGQKSRMAFVEMEGIDVLIA